MTPLARRTLLAAFAAAPGAALAQGEAARIIASAGPGTPLDGIARLIAEAMQARGLPGTIVENRPGAGGNLGAAAAARAAPDGRTFLLALDSTFTVNPVLYRNTGFDPAALAPVAIAGTAAVALLVHPSTGITTLAEFAAAARRQPMLYVSAGNGSPGHLTMAYLGGQLGLPNGALEHVPFRSAPEATTDLVAGRAQAGFITPSGAMPLIQAGRLRVIGVSTPARLPSLPDVPTMAELGIAGFDVRFAYVLMAPRGVPAAAVATGAAAVEAVFADPAVRARLPGWSVEPDTGDSEAARRWMDAAAARWRGVVRATGMQVD